jgi:hypothetical protein
LWGHLSLAVKSQAAIIFEDCITPICASTIQKTPGWPQAAALPA